MALETIGAALEYCREEILRLRPFAREKGAATQIHNLIVKFQDHHPELADASLSRPFAVPERFPSASSMRMAIQTVLARTAAGVLLHAGTASSPGLAEKQVNGAKSLADLAEAGLSIDLSKALMLIRQIEMLASQRERTATALQSLQSSIPSDVSDTADEISTAKRKELTRIERAKQQDGDQHSTWLMIVRVAEQIDAAARLHGLRSELRFDETSQRCSLQAEATRAASARASLPPFRASLAVRSSLPSKSEKSAICSAHVNLSDRSTIRQFMTAAALKRFLTTALGRYLANVGD